MHWWPIYCGAFANKAFCSSAYIAGSTYHETGSCGADDLLTEETCANEIISENYQPFDLQWMMPEGLVFESGACAQNTQDVGFCPNGDFFQAYFMRVA
jgi:hypothetical protein